MPYSTMTNEDLLEEVESRGRELVSRLKDYTMYDYGQNADVVRDGITVAACAATALHRLYVECVDAKHKLETNVLGNIF